MSRKPAQLPFFPDAYHRDTTHLTTEEHGAYFLLLMAAWGTPDCSLPNDERRLAALAKLPLPKWRKLAPTILEFWTIDKGRITQRRLRKEWSYVHEVRSKRKAAADARWTSKDDANAYANRDHMECTYGGGGGGGNNQSQGISLTGEGYSHTRDGLTVISGGGK